MSKLFDKILVHLYDKKRAGMRSVLMAKKETIRLPEGLSVLPKYCFCGNDRLKKVVLPSTLEKIDDSAFLDCTNLVEVDFSKCEKLQTIEQNAFCSCINLKKVILPDTITKIGRQAFLGCEKLAEIHLPTNLLSIEEKVLCHTKSLQNITLPQNLKEIKKSAFADSGVEKIVLPKSVKKIGEKAFTSSQLQEIEFDENQAIKFDDRTFSYTKLKSFQSSHGSNFGNDVFRNCHNLFLASFKDDNHFGVGMFKNCSGLCYVRLPKNLTVIPAETFMGTRKLKLEIPNTVTKIEKNAINAHTMDTITLPKSIKEIEENGICFERVREINFEKGSRYDVVKQEDEKMHIIKVEKISKPKAKEEKTIKESAQTNQTARAC